MNRLRKISAGLLIAVFVSFVFANTVFVHVHDGGDGFVIKHSHPYNPWGAHSHKNVDLAAVGQMNALAGAFMAQDAVGVAPATFTAVRMEAAPAMGVCPGTLPHVHPRGPPCEGIMTA